MPRSAASAATVAATSNGTRRASSPTRASLKRLPMKRFVLWNVFRGSELRRRRASCPTRTDPSSAYFDDAQCAATERAAKRAGCEKVRLLREPVAAAIAYGVDVGGDETVFVFDLGGGTFDVSVLDVGGGVVEVLATGGDPHLGGDDLDRALALWLAREAEALGAGVDPRGALMAARRASCLLYTSPSPRDA